MVRTKNPAPRLGPQRRRHRAGRHPRVPRAAPTGGSPAVAVLAVLAVLAANPGGATVAGIAGYAQISVAAARQALIAHEKAGAATRVKGGRPGTPDTWKPAGQADAIPAGPLGEAQPAQASGTDGAGTAEPAAGDTAAPADAGQPTPAPAGGEGETGPSQGPDPAVTAEAAGNVLAVAQAAGEAGKALAAGDLPAALADLEAAREQAAQGRRVLKAAARGRRAAGTRPGGLRDLVGRS